MPLLSVVMADIFLLGVTVLFFLMLINEKFNTYQERFWAVWVILYINVTLFLSIAGH